VQQLAVLHETRAVLVEVQEEVVPRAPLRVGKHSCESLVEHARELEHLVPIGRLRVRQARLLGHLAAQQHAQFVAVLQDLLPLLVL